MAPRKQALQVIRNNAYWQTIQFLKLAGGSINNIIVSAACLASANGGVVTMEHLLYGTRRELQKMGRLVGEKDLDLSSDRSEIRQGKHL